jgi:hypothetical protein
MSSISDMVFSPPSRLNLLVVNPDSPLGGVEIEALDGSSITVKVPATEGPPGPTGPQGETGPTGPSGPQGAAGSDGADSSFPEAPTDGKVYGRKSAAWAPSWVQMTQAAYDALTPKDANTLYVIVG